MEKLIYFFRVLFASLEFVVILLATYIVLEHGHWIESVSTSIQMNDELSKTLMVLPLGTAVWILNELRQLVFEDKDVAVLLVKWPNYWRLKQHIWVSCIYAFIFAFTSAFPWVVKDGLKSGIGMTCFVFSIIGQLVVAFSVYAARFRIREITIKTD